jgi:hypothetical protein
MNAAPITTTARSTGLGASIAASVTLLVMASVQWWLVEWLTPFLMPPLYLAVLVYFGVALVWSTVRVFMKGKQAWGSFAVCVGTLLIWIFVPFTDLWIQANYWYYRDARDAVVAQVLAGSLRPNVDYNSKLIALPPHSPHVSVGGNEIVVEEHDGKRLVFFYTFRGILDHYSGFLFVPQGAEPLWYSDLGEPCCTQLVKYSDRWFWASHR